MNDTEIRNCNIYNPLAEAYDNMTAHVHAAIDELYALRNRVVDIEGDVDNLDNDGEPVTDRSDDLTELLDALQGVVDYGGDELDTNPLN